MALTSSDVTLLDLICQQSPNFDNGTLERIIKCDAVLVLGQALNKDGTASQTLVNRAHAAALLYVEVSASTGRDGQTFKVLVTGGDPVKTGTSEAEVMKGLLVREHGIPEDAILMESKSWYTLENAYFSYDILVQHSLTRGIALLTSEFHCPRAMYVFEAVFHEKASQGNIALTPGLIPIVPLPIKAGAPSSQIVEAEAFARSPNSAINEQTLLQRLVGERGYLEHETVDSFHQHILGGSVVIPVPAKERLDTAKQQVDQLLESCKKGGLV